MDIDILHIAVAKTNRPLKSNPLVKNKLSLHRNNPFTRSNHLQKNWKTFSWFPSKLSNLHDWTLHCLLSNRITFVKMVNKNGTSVKVNTPTIGGSTSELYYTMLDMLNCTLKLITIEKDYRHAFETNPNVQYSTDYIIQTRFTTAVVYTRAHSFYTERTTLPFVYKNDVVFNNEIFSQFS